LELGEGPDNPTQPVGEWKGVCAGGRLADAWAPIVGETHAVVDQAGLGDCVVSSSGPKWRVVAHLAFLSLFILCFFSLLFLNPNLNSNVVVKFMLK
jgi:hypothetical protein